MQNWNNPIFMPGQNWLYYKIYCGPQSADIILSELIKPLVEILVINKIIDKWFFIRYFDPELHIRIRFHLINTMDIATIISEIEKNTDIYIQNHLIWKIQLDTYFRELWRYGENSIELVESIFLHDSNLSVYLIENKLNPNPQRLWKYAIKSIDTYLDDFQLTLPEKLELMSELSKYFQKAFGFNKDLMMQLDYKYRKEKESVSHFIKLNDALTGEDLVLINLLSKKTAALKPIIAEIISMEKNNSLIISKKELIKDLLHLMINRMFTSKQKKVELVIYYFLCEYYKSATARSSSNNKK
jgi:thiopeptide-type bacteriocin biosynthesis protein